MKIFLEDFWLLKVFLVEAASVTCQMTQPMTDAQKNDAIYALVLRVKDWKFVL